MRKVEYLVRIFLCLVVINIPALVYAQPKVNQAPQKVKSSLTKAQSAGAEVYRKNVESIVLIDVEDTEGRRQGSGVSVRNGVMQDASGMYVPASSWVVTNAHVVKNAKNVSAIVSGYSVKGEVKYRDDQMDIAFIYFSGTVVKPVSLGERLISLAPGDAVFAIGAPRGLNHSITEGIVSAVRVIDGIRLIQTSAAISPGSSGGGLFSLSGDLVGITTFKLVGGESLNFAVDAENVSRLLAAYDAAEMIKATFDPKFYYIFDDKFVRWVYSAPGNLAKTILEEYKSFEERWLKNLISYDDFNNKLFEIGNRYYLHSKALMPGSDDVAVGGGESGSSKLVLVCELYGYSNGQPRVESFEIDFAKSLIEGYPAKINSTAMQYSTKNKEGTQYTMVFDRNAGTLTVSTERFARLFHGKCVKSDKKVF